jgi:non-ribosomal peptide synthetase component E (peptide arylation enzyme)
VVGGQQLAPWKLPQFIKVYEDALPRNQMGKVNKKELLKIAFPDEVAQAEQETSTAA